MPVSARTRDADCGHAEAYLHPLIHGLDAEYRRCIARSRTFAGQVPPNGGEWLDYFLKAEALYGFACALRFGRRFEDAIQDGVEDVKHAVALWNRSQAVKQTAAWADDYLHAVARFLRGALQSA